MTTAPTYTYYDKIVIGTCSVCGGPVSVPAVWHGIIPPTPTCERCGAVKADNYGPVIPMIPANRTIIKTTDTSNV
jgi:hypothetical protein